MIFRIYQTWPIGLDWQSKLKVQMSWFCFFPVNIFEMHKSRMLRRLSFELKTWHHKFFWNQCNSIWHKNIFILFHTFWGVSLQHDSMTITLQITLEAVTINHWHEKGASWLSICWWICWTPFKSFLRGNEHITKLVFEARAVSEGMGGVVLKENGTRFIRLLAYNFT